MTKGIGRMGLVGFGKGTVKVRLWIATVFFILVSIGAVVLVSWGINKLDNSSNRLNRLSCSDGFSIAGAGDEGIRKVHP